MSCVDRSKLIAAGLGRILPKRRHKRGTAPGEFTAELNKKAACNSIGEVLDDNAAWTISNDSKYLVIKFE